MAVRRPARVSLIVTTYENPRSLELVLTGIERQTARVDELLVADDGSGPETKVVVEAFGRELPFPVRHVWQEQRGFRKCALLNRAVVAATGDYLIFLDGDCIPPRTFVEAHLANARQGCFVSGSKIFLSDAFSRALTPDSIRRGVTDRFGSWWFTSRRGRRLLIRRIPLLARLLDLQGLGWRGENASTFKEHIERVNGFDERFSYGWEDADFGYRLVAAGIGRRSIRYRCPVLHIDHPRPYKDAESLRRNRELYEVSRAASKSVTPYGLRDLTGEAGLVDPVP